MRSLRRGLSFPESLDIEWCYPEMVPVRLVRCIRIRPFVFATGGNPALLLHASLCNADVVAGAVLHHVHHFIGLADYVVRSFGIVRVGGEPH